MSFGRKKELKQKQFITDMSHPNIATVREQY